jgi:hypothetical protein
MATAKVDPGVHVPTEFVTIVLDAVNAPPLKGFRSAAAGDVSIVDGIGNTRVIVGVLAGETVRGCIQTITTSNTTVASPTTNILGLR